MKITKTKPMVHAVTYQAALPGDLASQLMILQKMAIAKDPPMKVDFMVWATYKDEHRTEITPMFFSGIDESTLGKLKHMIEVVEEQLRKR